MSDALKKYKDKLTERIKLESFIQDLEEEVVELTNEIEEKRARLKELDVYINGIESQLQSALSSRSKSVKNDNDDKFKPRPQDKSNLLVKDILFHSSYDENWTNSRKVKHVLASFKRCLTTRQIVDSIKRLELGSGKSDRTYLASISATLSTGVNKYFNRYKEHETEEWRYGLVDWFDNNGKIIDEFRYRQ